MEKWIVSLKEFKSNKNIFFKVTRRMPDLSVAETKIFHSQEEAIKQFIEWSV